MAKRRTVNGFSGARWSWSVLRRRIENTEERLTPERNARAIARRSARKHNRTASDRKATQGNAAARTCSSPLSPWSDLQPLTASGRRNALQHGYSTIARRNARHDRPFKGIQANTAGAVEKPRPPAPAPAPARRTPPRADPPPPARRPRCRRRGSGPRPPRRTARSAAPPPPRTAAAAALRRRRRGGGRGPRRGGRRGPGRRGGELPPR
jgi:hypothetical protein